MRIANNIMALNAHRQLMINQGGAAKSIEKLSSGLRINRAGDDAAGLAISEKMRGQIRGLNQAMRNAQDGISLIQTAEGALSETHAILQRMRELAVQAATDTNTPEDRAEIQREINQLKAEVDRIANTTEFNTKKLLDGSISGNAIGGQGSALGEPTSAQITIADFDPDDFTQGITSNWQVVVDGVTFTLSDVDTSKDLFTFWSSLETKLSNAIEAYNTANPDAQVAKPIFEITNVQASNEMTFQITSATTGSASRLEIYALHKDGATAFGPDNFESKLIDADNWTQGTDGVLSAEAASAIAALNPMDTFSIFVNGHNIVVTLANVGALENPDNGNPIAEGDEISLVAEALQEDINKALSDYKDLTGIDFGTVTVSVQNGTLIVSSSDPDATTIEFEVSDETLALGVAGTGTTDVGGLTFHIGANKAQNINLRLNDMRAAALNIADIDVSTREGADNAIATIDEAIQKVSEERSKLGAVQNRLEHTISNLGTSAENLQAAESRIRDVDMAKEMMNFTKYQILQQASTAMLAQANLAPQSVLQLLG